LPESPFFMVVARKPMSANKGTNKKYKDDLRARASECHRGKPVLSGPLYVRINWFHRERAETDVDNITKMIIDALKGVVFSDDFQIIRFIASRIDAGGDYDLGIGNVPQDALGELQSMLGNAPHILTVEVGEVISRYVRFGPLEEETF